ncbi:MAG: hypothetical protein ACE5GD_07455 [Candidatus Geothermarchaeales archaeon]
MGKLTDAIVNKIREFNRFIKISDVSGLSRRYFVMNSFDGVITILGVITGSYATGADPRFIIGAGLGASLAMGISGFTGAYLVEKAERSRMYKALEQAMLTQLDKSIHFKASRFASFWVAFVDGASPLMSAILALSPFFLSLLDIIPTQLSFLLSLGFIMAILLTLGIFLAKISREKMVVSVIRMMVIGLATALISLMIGGL